jgi:hypothetical protein
MSDRVSDSPLHIAVKRGNERVTRLLIDARNVDTKNGDGDTLLHLAIYHSESLVRLIVDHGIYTLATNDVGYTALQQQMEIGDEDKIRTLVNAHPDPDAAFEDINTMRDPNENWYGEWSFDKEQAIRRSIDIAYDIAVRRWNLSDIDRDVLRGYDMTRYLNRFERDFSVIRLMTKRISEKSAKKYWKKYGSSTSRCASNDVFMIASPDVSCRSRPVLNLCDVLNFCGIIYHKKKFSKFDIVVFIVSFDMMFKNSILG